MTHHAWPLGVWFNALGCLWLTMSLGACGGDSPARGSSTPPVDSTGFASSFASAYCDSIAPCCQQASLDASSCRATLEPQMAALMNVRTSDTKIVYDAAAGARCIEAYRAALAACTDRNLAGPVETACDGVFRGTVPEGGSCGESLECIAAAGSYASCTNGVCTLSTDWLEERPRAAAGQACAGTCRGDPNYGASCWSATDANGPGCWIDDGLYCADGTCAAVAAIGQPCSGDNYCVAAGHCESGTCVADVATGPCTSDDACVSTSYCDLTASQCTPRKANGESCDLDSDCLGGQCEQDRCRTWSMATAGACAGLLDD